MRATENAGGQPLGRHPSPGTGLTEGKPPDGGTTHQATRRKSRRAVEWLKAKYAGSAAVTGTSWVFFILGGVAAACTVQSLYQRAFQVMWHDRGMSFRSAAKKLR